MLSSPSSPVSADGSPAVRAPPTPRGTGAPGVAAESSRWGPDGRTKIPAPYKHLLRPERPPTSPFFLRFRVGTPPARLHLCLAGVSETTRPKWQHSPPSASFTTLSIFPGNRSGCKYSNIGNSKVGWSLNPLKQLRDSVQSCQTTRQGVKG